MSINGIETIVSLASPTIRKSTKFMASSIASIDKKDIFSAVVRASLIVICLTRITEEDGCQYSIDHCQTHDLNRIVSMVSYLEIVNGAKIAN